MLAQDEPEMGLLHLVLLHLLVHRRLRREDVFSFLARHVIQYMEKSRACTYGNIINMTATVIFVPKWIMILVGCAAIWRLESLRNQYEWHTHKHCTTKGSWSSWSPWQKKGCKVIFFLYKDKEQIYVEVGGKEAT
jgi:hypothetical protein